MHMIKTIGVIGAGQMGGGIAQAAAATGFKVVVYDSQRAALTKCEEGCRKRLMREVEKQRMTPAQVENAISHLTYTDNLEMLKGSGHLHRGDRGGRRGEEGPLQEAGGDGDAQPDPGEQHELDQHHGDRGGGGGPRRIASSACTSSTRCR